MEKLVDPVSRESYPEYFKLFKGEVASANQIRVEHPYLNLAVENMIKRGEVIGQKTFLNQEVELVEDTLYIMPCRGGSYE